MVKIIILILMLGVSGWSETEQYKLKPNEVKVKIEKPRNKIIEGKDDIKFFDGKGRVIKKIPLITEIKTERKNGSDDRKMIKKSAVISKNGKHAGLSANIWDIFDTPQFDEDGREYFRHEGMDITGIFSFYDNTGKVLWEKKFPESGIEVSSEFPDNGEYIGIAYSTTTLSAPDFMSSEKYTLSVFDRNGKEVLVFPTEDEYKEGYGLTGDIIQKVSPNGRYLAISIGKVIKRDSKYKSKYMTRFYDLKTGSFWDAFQRYVIYELSNDAVAEVDYYDIGQKKRSKTENIDLKKHLRSK